MYMYILCPKGGTTFFCAFQEVKSNPVFLITEEDLKQASILTESTAPSKKERREAERRKKAAGL